MFVLNTIRRTRIHKTFRMMSNSMFPGADRIQGSKPSVWVEFTALANKCNAVNLGQGFPDYPVPDYIYESLQKSASEDNYLTSQYTRGFGHPPLVESLSKLYSTLINHNIDPMNEVLTTIGAYHALYYACMGHLNPGDEALIIEPYYDCYEPQVKMAHAVPVFITLKLKESSERLASSADLLLDFDELEKKMSNKTKMIFVNNPHNPSGKVFTMEELMNIAKLAEKYNLIVIADEVYEWLVYEPSKMIRFASLPNMWKRTITIGSAGKTFSATGWKCGWAIAPEYLLEPMKMVHQNCTFTCVTPIQDAVARGFEVELKRLGSNESYFWTLPNKELLPRRDKMVQMVLNAGMKPIVPQAGYFMLLDYSNLKGPFEVGGAGDESKDYRFVRWLCNEKRLAMIPPSAFYSQPSKHLAQDLVRICFFKKYETLLAAEKILQTLS